VILDPGRRLGAHHKVFTDGAAETLLVWGDGPDDGAAHHGQAEILRVRAQARRLDLPDLLDRLSGRGLWVRFVEGGGVTVSSFLRAGLLHRLQVAVAAVIIGDGRAGLQLPPTEVMDDCLRLEHRLFRMGADILFDCEPPQPGAGRRPAPPKAGVARVL
jgi:riboflavin biosynthesis pyrimidine reductase